MRGDVEAATGGLVLFLQGAAANINPDMHWEDGHAFEKAGEQGSLVAKAVLETLDAGSEEIQGTLLKLKRTDAWLPTETAVTSFTPPEKIWQTAGGDGKFAWIPFVFGRLAAG